MPWVTEEEIQAAKNMTAYEYLRTHQAQRLQKTRTRNEWQLTDHDSFKINELSSKWHWKSRDIGGVSALRFLIEVDGMKFTDAVKLLCEESPSFIPTRSVEREKLPFKLPERYCNCRRIRAYLNHRGISDEVITYCISHEILYESVPYHNAVFVEMCIRDSDPSSRVACEVLATRGNVFVAGEISSGYEPPVFDVIRKVLEECGYCTDGIEMDTFVHQQSPDIAKAVSCLLYTSRCVEETGLGLIGDEYKNVRKHLLANLDGDLAWRYDKSTYECLKKNQRTEEVR